MMNKRFMNPLYEEKIKRRQQWEQEKKEKNKQRFNHIIQQNQQTKEVEEIGGSSSDGGDIDLEVTSPVDQAEEKQVEGSQGGDVIPEEIIAEQSESFTSQEGTFYEVCKILDKRLINGYVEYLVKWKNLPIEESTWEPEQNLIYAQHFVDQFNEDFEKIISKRLKNCPKKKAKVKKTRQGDYEVGDRAAGIVGVKREEGLLIFEVEWMPRNNGSVPIRSWYTNKQLRKLDPFLLLSFYESKVKLVG
jgi:hypothetical protein